MIACLVINWIDIRIPDAGGYMPCMRNSNFHKAKMVKNDEFYTRYEDVVAECEHYDFTGLHVMVPFDDPEWSAFYKYFDDNFERLGLAGLTCTHRTLDGSPSYALVRDGGAPTRRVDLVRDGDFFTLEVNKLMQQCDVVVSNPPFSIWRKIFQNLMEWDMKFLLLSSNPAFICKHVMPYVCDGSVRNGFNIVQKFDTPDGDTASVACRWLTNLPAPPHYRELMLTRHYADGAYKKLLNYDAIYVPRVADIPVDYDGVMAVPVTFIDYWNPDDYRILGNSCTLPMHLPTEYVNAFNKRAMMNYKNGISGYDSTYETDLISFILDDDNNVSKLYTTLMIQRI